jgi:hypothetical protein
LVEHWNTQLINLSVFVVTGNYEIA